MSIRDWMSGRVFQFVHGHNLVYNTCWEDPRLDRQAMKLTGGDNVLVITSAGCNALDYALEEPQRVYAVDMNPRQNALLELKLAGIRELEFEEFFKLFGTGYFPEIREVYHDRLRQHFSPWSRTYWDRWIKFFDNRDKPFYFRGTSGVFARMINFYVDHIVRLRAEIEQLLSAESLETQQQIYANQVRDRFWTRSLRFVMRRDATLSMVGVPRPQRFQVERDYDGGIVKFIEDCLDSVFSQLPLADNYFWRVYIMGKYSQTCCPEYLKADNFARLKAGLVDRITVATDSVQGFLEKHDVPISRFVLLDHMDWLSTYRFSLLEDEWQWIVRRATSSARILWRSGGLKTDFVDRVQVIKNGKKWELGDLLTYDRLLAEQLHVRDRVHTYGSFSIADLAA